MIGIGNPIVVTLRVIARRMGWRDLCNFGLSPFTGDLWHASLADAWETHLLLMP